MKVLYIATAYNRHSRDVITPWLVETIRGLKRIGVDVEVLAPSYRGLASGVQDGVRVHRFRYAPRRWEDLTHDQTAPDRVREHPGYLALVPGYVIAGMIAARRVAKHGRFDVVHVHWPIPHGLFGIAARWATGCPLVCSFHGVELTWTTRQLPFFVPFLRHVIRTADAVTANSSYTTELVRRIHDRRVERIPFGATIEPSARAMSCPRGRTGAFELLFVGRLVERKGVHYLLEALARLDHSRHVVLRVIGDGPTRAALEARATALGLGERVCFEGFVSADDLARRYAACDAFVLPAVFDSKGDTEGLGVVLVEALGYGRVVVASAVGGIVDVIRDGETGVLVPPGDVQALTEAIERIMDDPETAAALGEAGRAHVEREFSWAAILDRLKELYTGLVRSTISER